MADIDYDELYNTYTNLGYNPARAASYTAYAYLTGNKIPTTRQYTQEEWYKNSAPDYYSVIKTPSNPDDPLKDYTSRIASAKSPKDVFAIAYDAAGQLNRPDSVFKDVADYRQYLMGLYNQKSQAETKFKQQTQKFTPKVEGLPSVTARYGVADDTITKGKVTRQIIAFKPATDYVNSKVASWTKALKKGTDYNTAAELASLTTQYRTALTKAVNEKLLTSARTPFVDAAYKRATGGK
jgi:hypothetical protein